MKMLNRYYAICNDNYYKIYNEDCRKTLNKIKDSSLDCIITSPFYNTNKKAGKTRTLKNCKLKEGMYDYVRYDEFIDNMSNKEYSDFMVSLFNQIEPKLKNEGCILFNVSYGSENTECMWLTLADILRKTNFTIVDDIIWKKKSALPNSCSPNKLTRIVEHIFVFCKRGHEKTFITNKKVVSTRSTGQKMYENIFNFIEAKNNDGCNKLNKATFSTELIDKLISIYVLPNSTVYDPFCGIGTTGLACLRRNISFIGSEISKAQCEYAYTKIKEEINKI